MTTEQKFRTRESLRLAAPIHGPNQTVAVIGMLIGFICMLYLTTPAGERLITYPAYNYYFQAPWTAGCFATVDGFMDFVTGSAQLLAVVIFTAIGFIINSFVTKAQRRRTETEFLQKRKERSKLN